MEHKELYEPTDEDWTTLSIIQFREPIELFLELVCNSYSKHQGEWVEELKFIGSQVLDSMCEKRFGKAKV